MIELRREELERLIQDFQEELETDETMLDEHRKILKKELEEAKEELENFK
jgi:hypothetical protein